MPILRLDGDASGAVKATSDVSNAAKKLDQDFKQVGITSDQLREQMQRAFNEKPIDTYIRKCDELAQKLAAGKLTVNQYVEQTDRLADSMRRANEAQDRLADAEYHRILDAELKKLPSITREIEKYHDEVVLTGTELVRFTAKQTESFGSTALREVAGYAAGMLSVGAAVGFVTSALRDQAEEKQRIAKKDETSAKAAGALSAIGGTAQDLAFARDLYTRGIVESDTEGIHAVTGFIKAGLNKTEKQYAVKLADEMLVDPSAVGEYSASVQAFRHSQWAKKGTFEEADKEIRAASRLTRYSPEEVALQATRLAQPGAENGMSQEEQIATLIVAANKTRNLKTGGTLAEDMVKKGDRFEGADAAEFSKTLAIIRGARGQGIGKSLVHTDPRMNAADASADEQARYEAEFADIESERESLFSRLATKNRQYNRRTNGYGIRGALVDKSISFESGVRRALGNEDEIIQEAATNQDTQQKLGLTKEDVDELKGYLKRQTEIMERDGRTPPPPNGRQE